MRDFQGKVAVVTGAASGMGKAMARRFAQEGMSVVLADFERAALDATAKEFTQQELNVHPVFADVARLESVEALRDEAIKRYGAVHVLVNNAGVADSARLPIWESRQEDWNWVFQINFWGVLHGIRAFVPGMVAHGQPGHVVSTASIAGLVNGGGIYGVSKHAVVSLSEALYRDLRVAEAQIGASVLCPPVVHTRIFESARNRPDGRENDLVVPPDFMEGAMQPEEIAEAVFEAVRDEQFYIVPRSRWDHAIERRFANIVARHNPEVAPLLGTRRQ